MLLLGQLNGLANLELILFWNFFIQNWGLLSLVIRENLQAHLRRQFPLIIRHRCLEKSLFFRSPRSWERQFPNWTLSGIFGEFYFALFALSFWLRLFFQLILKLLNELFDRFEHFVNCLVERILDALARKCTALDVFTAKLPLLFFDFGLGHLFLGQVRLIACEHNWHFLDVLDLLFPLASLFDWVKAIKWKYK